MASQELESPQPPPPPVLGYLPDHYTGERDSGAAHLLALLALLPCELPAL